MKNVKAVIRKAKKSGQDIRLALFEFRNLVRTDGFSPAQMMVGRRQRGLLPVLPVMNPPVSQKEAGAAREKTARETVTRRNLLRTSLRPLVKGDSVLIQHPKTNRWSIVCQIERVREGGHSFDLTDDTGSKYVRNRRFLRLFKSCIQRPTVEEEGKPALRRSLRLQKKHVLFQDGE